MAYKKNRKKVLLGYFSVDSGQVLIVDPCYLDDWKDGEFKKGDYSNHYSEAANITLFSKNMGGEIIVSGPGGTGVVSQTGIGDGLYPVEAIIENGIVIEISISFHKTKN